MSCSKPPLLIVLFIVLALSSAASAPVDEQDIGRLYCRGPTDVTCCPVVAHHVAAEHYARAASIILINQSGYQMVLLSESLDAGDWLNETVNCQPKKELDNGHTQAFSSITSHFLGGAQGHATFMIKDGALSAFTISWEAPTVGHSTYSVTDLPPKYNVTTQVDIEETVYKVTVTNQEASFHGNLWSKSTWTLSLWSVPLFIPVFCGCCIFIYPLEHKKKLHAKLRLFGNSTRSRVESMYQKYFVSSE